ncbi:hypothetical protein CPB83DRAFT_766388 [Crepidotus variabilis]|uniref:RRM domain-containing protein n=1 Tax=Crepidotus variabilis TaxID=179855 RepID=A0A9P6EGY7_9AGAR|nr:hypothetical protein CPB83DRAFT_766388 [Crepidotus variabilis]
MERPYVRYGNVHGPKRQLLGNRAQPPPAWRTNNVPTTAQLPGVSRKGKEVAGSKIFISSLPFDVGETEVEELFQKTVGPLREVFVVYNSQGRSKGMAVVTFQRAGDAAVARAKYHGKVVDGRRPIQIELMVENLPVVKTPPINPPNTLLSRIAPAPMSTAPTKKVVPVAPVTHFTSRVAPALVAPASIPPRRVRTKKGPKRLNKRAVTAEDLDQEMEDYRAAAIGSSTSAS